LESGLDLPFAGFAAFADFAAGFFDFFSKVFFIDIEAAFEDRFKWAPLLPGRRFVMGTLGIPYYNVFRGISQRGGHEPFFFMKT
jgi:hypothetical protein